MKNLHSSIPLKGLAFGYLGYTLPFFPFGVERILIAQLFLK